ncbi:SDR family NAD(P)-dependent oxidoreductase [Phenylobacterium sp.]|uniref:SDR family NAD(P)-dependent oxidoreductase n=1 Tax=Phenylobacterium sp. TaxID=1871053 RepID=UPI002F3E3713
MTGTPNTFDLTGQTAFITGAGQGVGRGIARLFAAHGAAVAVNDYFLDRAEAVADELKADGAKAFAVQADVSDIAAVREAFAKTEAALGAPSILVNNAGNAGPDGFASAFPLFWETEPEDWDRFFRVNLFGVMNCCRVAAPAMVKKEYGRIVTIVSDAGRVGESRMADYAAAKAGAAGFMRGLARDAGRYNVTANNIALGTVRPPMTDEQRETVMSSERVKAQLSRYVIRRFGQPEDIAAMALFLCSREASWVTGQTYPVNGGYSFSI